MLTPCLLIPWSSFFHLLDIVSGLRLFSFSLPQQICSLHPPEVPQFPCLSFIWSNTYKFIACCWRRRVGESSERQHEYQNGPVCFYWSNCPPVRCKCTHLRHMFWLQFESHYHQTSVAVGPRCLRTASQSFAEQQPKLNSRTCFFFFSWQKAPCLLTSYKL